MVNSHAFAENRLDNILVANLMCEIKYRHMCGSGMSNVICERTVEIIGNARMAELAERTAIQI